MKLLALLVICLAAASAFAPPCYWYSPTFAGLGGCASESCGAGCSVDTIGPNTSVCYQNGSDCCECYYYTYTCQCTFGTGSGRVAARYSKTGSICDAATGQCSGISNRRLPPVGGSD